MLAALRYWQRHGANAALEIWNIATDDDECRPLDEKEIDTLCEHVNCAVPWLIHLEPRVIHSALNRKDQWLWPSTQVIVWAASEDAALDELSEHIPISDPGQWVIEAINLHLPKGEEPWTLAT